jgi:hypothetical protein
LLSAEISANWGWGGNERDYRSRAFLLGFRHRRIRQQLENSFDFCCLHFLHCCGVITRAHVFGLWTLSFIVITRPSRKQIFQLTPELICLLVLVPSTTLSADHTTQRRRVGWLVSDEFKMTDKQAALTKPETVPGIFEGWTE